MRMSGLAELQAWLILQAHRARALGPRSLGGPQKYEKEGEKAGRERERERERRGEKEKRKKESK